MPKRKRKANHQKMSPLEKFEKRIAEIHGLNGQGSGLNKFKGHPVDIRHEEFQAMVDAFLGEGYNPKKLREVEDQQIVFLEKQEELCKQLESQKINPEKYLVLFQDLAEKHFKAIETVLGPKDFKRLFGATPSEAMSRIDKDLFLKGFKKEKRKKKTR